MQLVKQLEQPFLYDIWFIIILFISTWIIKVLNGLTFDLPLKEQIVEIEIYYPLQSVYSLPN